MKKIQPWLIAALFLYSIFMTFTSVDNKDLAEHYRLEKERAQRHIKKQIDSVNSVIKRKDLQILQAMKDVREAEILAEIAEEKAVKIKQKYDQIRFVSHPNDSARSAAIRAIVHN